MNPELLEQACSLYLTSVEKLEPLSGGYYNAVYRFPLDPNASNNNEVPGYGVLRIGIEDCPAEQTQGMLEWVRYLGKHGASVTMPILSKHGRILEHLEQDGEAFTITAFGEVEGTLAERIPLDEWTDELFESIGKAAGKLHAVSTSYRPPSSTLTRPHWYDAYEVRDATKRLAGTSDPAGEKLANLINELKLLPTEASDFGLIHDDLHFANFLIGPSGKVTIIDFDDCVYGWFVADVAMALFDVLVLYHATDEAKSQSFARHFMQIYLSGYRQEKEISSFWLGQMPRFLKLKELCVYASLIGHSGINQPESWVGRFMHGRVERIANDIPYVDIDFMRL